MGSHIHLSLWVNWSAAIAFFLCHMHMVRSSCHHGHSKYGNPMPMYFTDDINIKFLFDYFEVKNKYEFIFCNVLCVLLGFLSIYVKSLKKSIFNKSENALEEKLLCVNIIPTYRNMTYGLISLINYTVDYLLMLIVMTFNVYIFLSVMTGVASAYFLCGHLI
ncbi:copper transporter, putative [Plasmodium ovale]|uniref:Copper transport protein n=1 Tax=Plasmodium ovale TaxID=36330 RepID=A0A1C3KXB4_PLAOA|nr:copper transporter, putative [Plasmodium ovale]